MSIAVSMFNEGVINSPWAEGTAIRAADPLVEHASYLDVSECALLIRHLCQAAVMFDFTDLQSLEAARSGGTCQYLCVQRLQIIS